MQWRSLSRELLPLALSGVGLSALYLASARPVQLVLDGEPQLARTHARQVNQVLGQLGIEVGEHDRVLPGMNSQLDWTERQLPTISIERSRPVVVTAGDQQLLLQSPETSAGDLLSAAGWLPYPGDRLQVDGIPTEPTEELPVSFAVRLERAFEVTLLDQGIRESTFSAAPTVGAALAEAGITLHQGDRVQPPVETPIDGPLSVSIERSRPMVIEAGGVTLRARSAASTVGEALAESGVPLVGLDYSLPPPGAPLPSDGQIRVVRVTETVTLELEPLPFDTVYQPLDALELDQQQVMQAGAYGVSTHRVRVRYEDGEEVSRYVEGEWIAKEPSPQIVGYGTRIEIRTVSTADGTLEYWRAVEMYATSYSPSRAGVSPDSPWFGITASGKPLKKGLVAIDRSLIPFGTRMYVPGYGFAEAADTGSGVKGRWIDLGYEDDNWVSWSGYVTVYFLTPVPSSIVYIFP